MVCKKVHYSLLIFTIGILSVQSSRNEKHKSKNAEEDSYLTTPQLLFKYGYPAEVHQVVTTDGYILNIHRIPHGKNENQSKIASINCDKKKVILLNHGVISSSADWIVTGPENALGYMLADIGYDVWLTNARGNTYSNSHLYLSNKSAEFWNFDWHEIAIYDLPAVIDYILSVTNNTALSLIGHSQGATTFYVLTSMLPEYNAKIRLHISLAPIAYLKHVPNLLLVSESTYNQPLLTLARILGFYDMLPASELRVKLTNAVCDVKKPLQPLCLRMATMFQNPANLNKTTFISVAGHSPAGSSWKQLEHFAQEINSGHFRQYDYGWIHNKRIYKSVTPPDYDLKKVRVPVVLIGARHDQFATAKDIDRLESELGNMLKRYTVSDQRFTHVDFLIGIDAKDIVYRLVLEILEEELSKT